MANPAVIITYENLKIVLAKKDYLGEFCPDSMWRFRFKAQMWKILLHKGGVKKKKVRRCQKYKKLESGHSVHGGIS